MGRPPSSTLHSVHSNWASLSRVFLLSCLREARVFLSAVVAVFVMDLIISAFLSFVWYVRELFV